MGRWGHLLAAVLLFLGAWPARAASYFKLPPLPPPALYGNLLIDRISSASGVKPVAFSHWIHRARYTCRVCHVELGFAMEVNTTEITEARCRKGEYCGACHDGKEAFGHTKKECGHCHSGDIATEADRFPTFAAKMPKAPYGNQIDWVRALKEGRIHPKRTLRAEPYRPIRYDSKLLLEAEWSMIPPAYFPHAEHNLWLDCANCHPAIFNVKKKTTKHFSMTYNLKGRFCGLCHLRVSFPLDDCQRCHPGMHR